MNLSTNCHFLSANFSYHPINITFFIFISLFNKYSFVFCFVIPYYQRNSNQPPKTDTFHPKICIFLITLILCKLRYKAEICESSPSVIISPSLRACLIAEVCKPLLCILLEITSASICYFLPYLLPQINRDVVFCNVFVKKCNEHMYLYLNIVKF